MRLSEVKKALENLKEIKFQLPSGEMVPKHFHITEIGLITKNFIDCGNTLREEKKINFQLWEELDYDHRLAPAKLNKIIASSEEILKLEDYEIEVEYQTTTIGKYNLAFENGIFQLKNTLTACLAKDNCGIEPEKEKVVMSELSTDSCCSSKSNCC